MKKLTIGLQHSLVRITNEFGFVDSRAGRCRTRPDSYTYAYPNPNSDPNSDPNPDSNPNSNSNSYTNTNPNAYTNA